MEVYTPIPDEALRRAPRAARIVGTIALAAIALVVVAAVFGMTFGRRSQPDFHNYGVVGTSFGIADVACGGEASDGCGVDTVVRFASCSPQYRDYFGDASGLARVDPLVRALIGKRPPSGNRWIAECGSAEAMISDQPIADLDSN